MQETSHLSSLKYSTPWDPSSLAMLLPMVLSTCYRSAPCQATQALVISRLLLMPTRTSSICLGSGLSPSSSPRVRRTPATTPSPSVMASKRIPSDVGCDQHSTTSLSSRASLTITTLSASRLWGTMCRSTLVLRRLLAAMLHKQCLSVVYLTPRASRQLPAPVVPFFRALTSWSVPSRTLRLRPNRPLAFTFTPYLKSRAPPPRKLPMSSMLLLTSSRVVWRSVC
mmetsp:Transcript_28052/g.59587  ORF Transcript_28052/g.59587 Transcript_28052/m.59587 type:complete len:225 (+) Transcript_28052:3535-4209(+)